MLGQRRDVRADHGATREKSDSSAFQRGPHGLGIVGDRRPIAALKVRYG